VLTAGGIKGGAGADVGDSLNRNIAGRTPLMLAAFDGDLDLVIRLLDEGSDPNARDAGGDTALMFAAMRGHFLIVKLLLAHGADPLASARNGWTALWFAESRHHREVASLLGRAEEQACREGLRELEAELGGER
jgi:uncharacterized protein